MPVKSCEWADFDGPSEECQRDAERHISVDGGRGGDFCNEHGRERLQDISRELMAQYVTDVKLEIPAELQCETPHNDGQPRRATLAVVVFEKGRMPLTVRKCHNCIADYEKFLLDGKLQYTVVNI